MFLTRASAASLLYQLVNTLSAPSQDPFWGQNAFITIGSDKKWRNGGGINGFVSHFILMHSFDNCEKFN